MLGLDLNLTVAYCVCVHIWTSSVIMFKVFGYVLESDPLGTERVLIAVFWRRFGLESVVLCMCTYVDWLGC